jgi:hypothetical protein
MKIYFKRKPKGFKLRLILGKLSFGLDYPSS